LLLGPLVTSAFIFGLLLRALPFGRINKHPRVDRRSQQTSGYSIVAATAM
jgi:hypothetical protein